MKYRSLKFEWSGRYSIAVLRVLALAIELSALQCLLWVCPESLTSYPYLLTRSVPLTGDSSHVEHLLLLFCRREKHSCSFAGRANPDSRMPRVPGCQYSLLPFRSIQLMTSSGGTFKHSHYPPRTSALSPRAFCSENHGRYSSICSCDFKD